MHKTYPEGGYATMEQTREVSKMWKRQEEINLVFISKVHPFYPECKKTPNIRGQIGEGSKVLSGIACITIVC